MKHTTTILRILPSFEKIGPVRGTLHVTSRMDRTHYQNLVAALNETGWGRHVQNVGSMAAAFDDANVPTFNLKLKKPWDLFLGVPRILDLIDTLNPDIVHTQLLRPHIYGRIAAKKRKKIIVSTVHNENQWLVEKDPVSLVEAYLDRSTSRYVDGFVAVAPSVKQFMIEHQHVPAEKITVIANGVDTGRFSRDFDREKWRAKLGLSSDMIAIGTVARVHEQKNPDMFLKVVEKVVQRIPSARFFWVGDGPKLAYFSEAVKERGLGGVCSFLGQRNDIPAILNALDIFILSSRYEGLPNALLEAMASRKACVATDVSGNQAVIESGVDGFLTPSDDVVVMTKQIIRLCTNISLRNDMGLAAFQKIVRDFSVDAMAAQYEAFYEHLLSSREKA